MTNIVVKPLSQPSGTPKTVTRKRVRGTDGRVTTVLTVDAESTTFGEDLAYAFGRNVNRARKKNAIVRAAGANSEG